MTETFLHNEWLLLAFVLVLLYLGWRIRKVWKNFKFYLIKRKGKRGEGIAIKLLNKEGYEIINVISEPIIDKKKKKINGKFLRTFFLKKERIQNNS